MQKQGDQRTVKASSEPATGSVICGSSRPSESSENRDDTNQLSAAFHAPTITENITTHLNAIDRMTLTRPIISPGGGRVRA